MRRLTEPQAHRARVEIIEGRFPEGMRARCALCGSVRPVEEGAFVDVRELGAGAAKVFRCGDCEAQGSAA